MGLHVKFEGGAFRNVSVMPEQTDRKTDRETGLCILDLERDFRE